jgi:tRNA threonylcarbamoyladenosine biosynthesis protein TsaE
MADRVITSKSGSPLQTVTMGRQMGELLIPGDVIALKGSLGSGKTWFTKGLALGMGIPPDVVVTSPSFSLFNAYEGRHPFFHMDAYRLETLSDFLSAGLDEYFYQDGVVVLEWADRFPEILPDRRLMVELTIVDEDTRTIVVSGNHPRAVEIMDPLEQQWNLL